MNADGLSWTLHLRESAFIGGSLSDLSKTLVFLRRRQVSPQGDKLFAPPQGLWACWLFGRWGGTPFADGMATKRREEARKRVLVIFCASLWPPFVGLSFPAFCTLVSTR
jgi:hypothetical protein